MVQPGMIPVRVLIVDDDEVVRVGLQSLLSREDSISVVGEVATVTDAVMESWRLKLDNVRSTETRTLL